MTMKIDDETRATANPAASSSDSMVGWAAATLLAAAVGYLPQPPIVVRSARDVELRPPSASEQSVYPSLSALIANGLFERTDAAGRSQLATEMHRNLQQRHGYWSV